MTPSVGLHTHTPPREPPPVNLPHTSEARLDFRDGRIMGDVIDMTLAPEVSITLDWDKIQENGL